MFTRQHYKAIAEIIKSNRGDGVEYTLDQVASKLADFFAGDNQRFNRNKFMEACGANEES